jgi:hypothetical protein
MVEGIRKIEPQFQDYNAVAETGEPLFLKGSISEEKIAKFCGGCDFLQADNICRVVDPNDQARYANRGCCGWARVEGISGKMTKEGFNAFSASASPSPK